MAAQPEVIDAEREIVEFVEEVEGIYFRSILIPKSGTLVPQHAHDHAHATYCGHGKAVYFVEGDYAGLLAAGHAISVKAGVMHAFLALADDTRLVCVHDAASAMSMKAKGD